MFKIISPSKKNLFPKENSEILKILSGQNENSEASVGIGIVAF